MNELDNFISGQSDEAAAAEVVNSKKKTKKVKEPKEPKTPKEAKVKEPKEPKVKEVKEKKPARDNISYIGGLTNIESVRKALQVAIAKRAKSINNEETKARYEIEIDTARTKLNEMIDLAKNSENFIQGLIDLGEEPNKILTHFIVDKENVFEQWLTENEFKVSRNTIKKMSVDIPMIFLAELPLDVHESVITRHSKGDFRLQAICKQFNFIDGVNSGVIVANGNKWTLPGDPEVTEEVVPEVVPEVTPAVEEVVSEVTEVAEVQPENQDNS